MYFCKLYLYSVHLCQKIIMKVSFFTCHWCYLRLLVPNFFFFFWEFKVTDDGDNNQDDARGSQLVQVQKKDSIIEKSFVKLKEASTVWISIVFHNSKYDPLSN